MLKRNARNQSGRASTKPGLESMCCSWRGWRCMKWSCPDASHMSRKSSSNRIYPEHLLSPYATQGRRSVNRERRCAALGMFAAIRNQRALPDSGPCTGRRQSSHRSPKAGSERGGRTCETASTCGTSPARQERACRGRSKDSSLAGRPNDLPGAPKAPFSIVF